MKTLYLERSTGECRNGNWVEALDLEGVGRIVVGTGPGSFAGIRSALAFAQGYAVGRKGVEVYGLPSASAIAAEAVVGDARQGKIWIAKFENGKLAGEVYQVEEASLASELEGINEIVSPDDRRIGEKLRALFGERYRGERLPTAAGLQAYAEAHPEDLKPEPLPIYLNPAVR